MDGYTLSPTLLRARYLNFCRARTGNITFAAGMEQRGAEGEGEKYRRNKIATRCLALHQIFRGFSYIYFEPFKIQRPENDAQNLVNVNILPLWMKNCIRLVFETDLFLTGSRFCKKIFNRGFVNRRELSLNLNFIEIKLNVEWKSCLFFFKCKTRDYFNLYEVS